MHLALMYKQIKEFQPNVVVVDPISNFLAAGSMIEAGAMLVRLIDMLKAQQITTLFTNLVSGGGEPEQTDIGISSIIDTWLLLRDEERAGERTSFLYISSHGACRTLGRSAAFVLPAMGPNSSMRRGHRGDEPPCSVQGCVGQSHYSGLTPALHTKHVVFA